jgi:hypothetical protein
MDCWGDDKHELPVWTPAPNPWRAFRRGTFGMVLAGLMAWGVWTVVQLLPTISFDAFARPTTAHIEAAKPVVIVEEQRPVQVQTMSAKIPLKAGSVVVDVTPK